MKSPFPEDVVLTDSDRAQLEPHLTGINKLKEYLAFHPHDSLDLKKMMLIELERTITKPRSDILRKLIGRLKSVERNALLRKLNLYPPNYDRKGFRALVG